MTTTLWKLTDADDRTYGGCQWGPGVTVTTSGKGELCGPGWTHWYTDPLLAVWLNPIHGDYPEATMHLWEGEGEIGATDHGLKVGCARATTWRRVAVPDVPLVARIRAGIECALLVYREPGYAAWADGWLSGRSRAAAAAADAAWAADAAADVAVAADAAADAAWAAAERAAARAAERAAERAARAADADLDLAGILRAAIAAERALDAGPAAV